MGRWVFIVVVAAAILVVARVVLAKRYEEPMYTLVERIGSIELRDYGPRLMAEVVISGGRGSGASDAFRVLAAYVFSPSTPSGHPIGMTVPVGQYRQDDIWRMWFVMPSRYDRESLPPTGDERISIVERPAERVAVVRLAGRMDTADFDEIAARVTSEVDAAGYRPLGPATLAVYNGPFTPGPLRRNEVMVPVSE